MPKSEKDEAQRAAFLMALRTVEEATSPLVSPSATLCSAAVELLASPAPDWCEWAPLLDPLPEASGAPRSECGGM